MGILRAAISKKDIIKARNRDCFAFRKPTRLLAAGTAVLCLSSVHGLAQQADSPFTQDEVAAGHASYHLACAQCHGDDLLGGGDAPPLIGGLFVQDWSKWTIQVFYRFVSQTMPQGLEGELDAKTYSDILSFLLAANGAKPGSTPFDRNSAIKIGDVTDGKTVMSVLNAPVDPQMEGKP